MTIYAGFDADQFPGLRDTDWLKKNTDLVWCGFYLGPAPSHGDAHWMGQRQPLIDQGWGLVPIFVGRQTQGPGDHSVNPANGLKDGMLAAALMHAAGFPAGSHVWIDVENGPPVSSMQAAYLATWASEVKLAGFVPEVYGSHLLATKLTILTNSPRPWLFKITQPGRHKVPGPNYSLESPVDSGFDRAWIWQHDQNAEIVCGDHTLVVDLSTAFGNNPSSPL